MHELKRPLAILGRRKIRQDLVEAALKEAGPSSGPRYSLDHIGQLQTICRDAEKDLRSKGVPKAMLEGVVVNYTHGTHQPRNKRSKDAAIPTLGVSLAYRNGTWLLESIRSEMVWKNYGPVRQITLSKAAIKQILRAALSGIASNEPDPKMQERFDLGGFVAGIADIILPEDPSSHQKFSAIQVVEALIASGYERNPR